MYDVRAESLFLDLLDERRINGTVAIVRQLRPPLVAGVLPADCDLAAGPDNACQMWGGASQLLLPEGRPAPFDGVERAYDADDVWTVQDERRWLVGSVPLLLLINATKPGRMSGSIEVVDLDADDPWRLSYLTPIFHEPR